MKRKFEAPDTFVLNKRVREIPVQGTKRKHDFNSEQSLKRFHQYNIVEEKDREIRHLHTLLQSMYQHIQKLEIQLEQTRVLSNHTQMNKILSY